MDKFYLGGVVELLDRDPSIEYALDDGCLESKFVAPDVPEVDIVVPHHKVYKRELLSTNPPKRKWICRYCGEQGIDQLGGYAPIDEYEKFVEFHNKEETGSI